MYDRHQWCARLVSQMRGQGVTDVLKDRYRLLFQVELGLRLLERLALTDETILVLWVLLSDNQLRHPRLLALDTQQRHEIANARILLPFAGRFNWENALQTYSRIDEQWRCYHVEAGHLDRQTVHNLESYQERLEVYDTVLQSILPFAPRSIEPAKKREEPYYFDALTGKDKQPVAVNIDQEIADLAAIRLPWFSQPRQCQSLEYSHDNFREIAQGIEDMRQQRQLEGALGSKRNWVELVEMVGYRAILPGEKLAARNTLPLRLEGHTYVVGAVAAGKSTIAKLIMADAALHPEKDLRVTLVVSDTMSALNLAHEFNTLFCKDGELPVAVPLVGRSTRHQHLQRLYHSNKFHSVQEHWALRWLNTACPLQALTTKAEMSSCTLPGAEPCESLYLPLQKPGDRKRYYACPLFAVCPSKQQYRDMPTACIWITTPGALGRSSMPSQLEERRVHLTEIVYEQSDLVIFDEADTVQEWFDNLFADEVVLTNGNNGLLDVEDVQTAQVLVPRRTQPPPTRRWVEAERHSLISISSILSNLTDRTYGPTLRHWIERNYFTALSLAYKLVWRLLGLPKWDDLPGQERIEAENRARPIVKYFDRLNRQDPLKIEQPPANPQDDPVYRLALIMRLLLAAGDSAHNPTVAQDCQMWILDFVPGIEETLQKLAEARVEFQNQPASKGKYANEEPPDPPDTQETLALRLEFVLSVMMLDRNVRIVFYEWYNKPYIMSTDLNDNSLDSAPSNLTDVLPVPPTGRVFGTYYSKGLEIGQDEQQKREMSSGLSVFGYANIGRWYTMHFHELFSLLDYRRGPNVLSLSGTSWLPHSSRWHIAVEPQGILEPPDEALEAIEQSVFSYIPQYRPIDKKSPRKKLKDKRARGDKAEEEEGPDPIIISGEPWKMKPIKELTRALVSGPGGQLSPLREELAALRYKAQKEPTYWADRERLLLIVNSYDQAKWVYQELRFSETYPGEIRYLARNKAGDDIVVVGDEDVDEMAAVYRSDIEDFASTGGKILIAPLQAIGRGYNILNQNGKAAFGAIYFLTRPMPHPADTQALARELNRRTLDWCADEKLPIWEELSIYKQALALREMANEYWREAELRTYYHTLKHKDKTKKDLREATRYSVRYDLAATTVGYIIQACGRLLRGGVPFHAFFVDAAWAPNTAKKKVQTEASSTSLLTAMLEVLREYIQDPRGFALYAPIVEAMKEFGGFEPKYDEKR